MTGRHEKQKTPRSPLKSRVAALCWRVPGRHKKKKKRSNPLQG